MKTKIGEYRYEDLLVELIAYGAMNHQRFFEKYCQQNWKRYIV